MTTPDTVFALASAAGRAAVAVVRVSGPETRTMLERLAGSVPPAREARVRTLRDAAGEVIDQALVLWLPGPHSFTGEDVCELHVHGGAAVVEAVLAALLAVGARPAAPGAFTRRAFENAKLDLAQAEAIADLVDAETDAQRRLALRQLDGELSALYERWRARLIEASAWLEAEIDFPDEDDVPAASASRAAPVIEDVVAQMAAHLADGGRGERVREGFRVVLLGAPNAGKSTLLNRLAGRDAAIVTPVPGTTRDVIEARRIIAGHAVVLADTAGLRETDDIVEREGVARARAAAADADLRIGVIDADAPETWADTARALRDDDLAFLNKTDLASPPAEALAVFHVKRLAGSARDGAGVDALEGALAAIVAERLSAREAPTLTRARHRRAVEEARAHLERAAQRVDQAPELAAEDVRLAARALATVTGRVDVEDVLDRIFADFCIGK